MAILTSLTGREALNFALSGFQYLQCSGGFYLEIDCSLLDPAEPERAFEVGYAFAGRDFAESLRALDPTQPKFHFACDFSWENDDGINAGWWIKKKAGRRVVNLEFVFLHTFNLECIDTDEDQEYVADEILEHVADEILEYVEPIRAARERFPGLTLALSMQNPCLRNGVIGVRQPSATTDVRRAVADPKNEFLIVESRARLKVDEAEFVRFRLALLQEIDAAERAFAEERKFPVIGMMGPLGETNITY